MSRDPAPSRRPQWPFWLLLAGWLCANQPQVATYSLLTWLDHARTFAHQDRLKTQVAYLLAGETPPDAVAHAGAARDEAPAKSCPADAVVSKVLLGLESHDAATVAARPPAAPAPENEPWPDSPRRRPPHGPPRSA